MDSMQINQPGKIVNGKLQLGRLVRKKVADGKFTSTFKMTRKVIPLGNGVELAEDMPATPNAVWLNVTKEAALRLGWLPVSDPKAELPKLRSIVGNEMYGESEQANALRTISEIDPSLGQALLVAYPFLAAA